MSDTYLWENFLQHPPRVQEEILKELELLIPSMTWKDAAKTFEGAPEDIILKYLPKLPWDSQVWIWKNALPIGARKQAENLLCREAKIVLRLQKKSEYKCLA